MNEIINMLLEIEEVTKDRGYLSVEESELKSQISTLVGQLLEISK